MTVVVNSGFGTKYDLCPQRSKGFFDWNERKYSFVLGLSQYSSLLILLAAQGLRLSPGLSH